MNKQPDPDSNIIDFPYKLFLFLFILPFAINTLGWLIIMMNEVPASRKSRSSQLKGKKSMVFEEPSLAGEEVIGELTHENLPKILNIPESIQDEAFVGIYIAPSNRQISHEKNIEADERFNTELLDAEFGILFGTHESSFLLLPSKEATLLDDWELDLATQLGKYSSRTTYQDTVSQFSGAQTSELDNVNDAYIIHNDLGDINLTDYSVSSNVNTIYIGLGDTKSIPEPRFTLGLLTLLLIFGGIKRKK